MKSPLVSAPPSTRLLFVAGYFTLTGSSIFAFVVISVVVQSMFLQAATTVQALTLGLRADGALVATLGLLWTGRALREQRRSGWWSALVTVAAPVITSLASPPWSGAVPGTSVVGLVLLASVRTEFP